MGDKSRVNARKTLSVNVSIGAAYVTTTDRASADPALKISTAVNSLKTLQRLMAIGG